MLKSRKLISIIFLNLGIFFSFSEDILSNELWNGFYEGMTPNQVKSRLSTIMKVRWIRDIKNERFSLPWIAEVDDWEMPYDRVFEVETDETQYLNINGEPKFYFNENKLYHIHIYYNLTGDEIYQKLFEKYGKPQKVIPKKIFSSFGTLESLNVKYNYTYIWEKNNEDTYIHYHNIQPKEKTYLNVVHFYNPKNKKKYDILSAQEEKRKEKQQMIEKMVF